MYKQNHMKKPNILNNYKVTLMITRMILGLAFVLIILTWIFVAIVGFKTADSIKTEGIRGVIQNIWCGKDSDCKLPM